ncbi:MAG: DUF547 domain-containing protein [Gammaproteobacteria bacterium]
MKKTSLPSAWLAAAAMLLLSSASGAAEPDWGGYNMLLAKYVKPVSRFETELNWVDYSRLKKDPGFEKTVALVESYPLASLTTQEEMLAFYINAYNILAIKTVLDHWPVKSIKDAGSFIFPVWYRNAGRIGGEDVTLNEIEHDVLRPMGDSRIHFAIVCASVSCPDLRAEAYTASKLAKQLDEQAERFLNNPDKGLYVESGQVHLSQIFDWFAGDFKKWGGVEAFLRSYRQLPENVTVKADIPYNWSLNGE